MMSSKAQIGANGTYRVCGFKGKIEVNGVIHPKTFFPFYPLGVAGYWKIYLQLLEKAITKEPKKGKTQSMAA
ncbi:MAG TPA: hypothetical protein VGW31_11815 [Hanamia sp.]|nr:hypothetical protein [Hanamia sp.]